MSELLKRKRADTAGVVPCHTYTKPGERGRASGHCEELRMRWLTPFCVLYSSGEERARGRYWDLPLVRAVRRRTSSVATWLRTFAGASGEPNRCSTGAG